jgi:hypothetical protein
MKGEKRNRPFRAYSDSSARLESLGEPLSRFRVSIPSGMNSAF